MNSVIYTSRLFESYRLTDRQTDRQDRNYIPRRFAGSKICYMFAAINQSINQYSFNERHVKTQANTCMAYN